MGYLYNLVALAVLCGCGSVLPFPHYSASAFMAQLWLNDRLVCICLCMRACGHHERANWEQSPIQLLRFRHRQAPQGSFNNYVVMILAFLRPPTYCYLDNFNLHVYKNKHFWTTYLPTSSRPRSNWTTPKYMDQWSMKTINNSLIHIPCTCWFIVFQVNFLILRLSWPFHDVPVPASAMPVLSSTPASRCQCCP